MKNPGHQSKQQRQRSMNSPWRKGPACTSKKAKEHYARMVLEDRTEKERGQ